MAKKKESTLINMLVALFVIAAISGLVLGLVYSVTKEPIAKVELDKNKKAIQAVLPFEGELTFKPDTLIHIIKSDTRTDTLRFPCTCVCDSLSGAFKGIAIKTSEGGFGGKVELMVGIAADGTILGTSVLSHSETPGLGANMTDTTFMNQFNSKKPGEKFTLQVTKNKEKEPDKVDAITAATITSKAFTNAVDKAYQAFVANKDQLANTVPAKEIIQETINTPKAEEETLTEETNKTKEGGTENE